MTSQMSLPELIEGGNFGRANPHGQRATRMEGAARGSIHQVGGITRHWPDHLFAVRRVRDRVYQQSGVRVLRSGEDLSDSASSTMRPEYMIMTRPQASATTSRLGKVKPRSQVTKQFYGHLKLEEEIRRKFCR